MRIRIVGEKPTQPKKVSNNRVTIKKQAEEIARLKGEVAEAKKGEQKDGN